MCKNRFPIAHVVEFRPDILGDSRFFVPHESFIYIALNQLESAFVEQEPGTIWLQLEYIM